MQNEQPLLAMRRSLLLHLHSQASHSRVGHENLNETQSFANLCSSHKHTHTHKHITQTKPHQYQRANTHTHSHTHKHTHTQHNKTKLTDEQREQQSEKLHTLLKHNVAAAEAAESNEQKYQNTQIFTFFQLSRFICFSKLLQIYYNQSKNISYR